MRLWVNARTNWPSLLSPFRDRQRSPDAEHGQSRGQVRPVNLRLKVRNSPYSVRAQGRLISPEEFGQIVVRETRMAERAAKGVAA